MLPDQKGLTKLKRPKAPLLEGFGEAIPYEFIPELVVRSPALPFPAEIDDDVIKRLLQDKYFMEAIYLASPVLYKECVKLKEGSIHSMKEVIKIKISLVKYYQRMSSRCTPFGLFSGCGVAKWGTGNKAGILFENDKITRHTRLDMHYLCALSQKLSSLSFLKDRLLYFPNNSIYCIGDELRYIEHKYAHGRRMHQISSAENTSYLQSVLKIAEKGATLLQAKDKLLQKGIYEEEAIQFLEELLQSRILVSELEPAVTGDEYIHQLITKLDKYREHNSDEVTVLLNILNEIVSRLSVMDSGCINEPCKYSEIIELLKLLEVEYDEGKLFQADLFKTASKSIMDEELRPELISALGFLNRLNSEKENSNLQSFITRFRDRYEDRQVPLLEALDTETGIGYPGGSGKDISPLTDDLLIPSEENPGLTSLPWNSIQQMIFGKLQKATQENLYSIQFTDDDLPGQKTVWNDLPPSFSIMFRIVSKTGSKILIDSIGGASAVNLLGRFAHGHRGIADIVSGITAKEQQLNNEIILAEIAHLPEGRTGNILLRPSTREYEIPYLAGSAVSAEKQVTLKDLLVSVTGGRISLFSDKLKKEIIPRLGTAHNFSNNTLPVYHFLCDLQTQGLRSGLGFHWGRLAANYKFLPRAEYGDSILCEATWQFVKKDIEKFINAIEENETDMYEDFARKWRLPRYFVMADGDNELLVDGKSRLSLLAFTAIVKNRAAVVLKEFLVDDTGLVADEKGRPFANQIIASLIKTEAVYKSSYSKSSNTNVKRRFEPGSEWLYYKFYCGSKSSDKILTDMVLPLAEKWQQEKIIDKWFFIRYHDPGFHLRVRFHLADTSNTGRILKEITTATEKHGWNAFITRTQLDTYHRELERYGPHCIEMAESLFHTDSLNILRFLQNTEGDERENIRWLWGIAMTDSLLNAFEFTEKQKQLLTHQLSSNFSKEFKAGKNLFLQINNKYNRNRDKIYHILTANNDCGIEGSDFIKAEVAVFSKQIRPVCLKIRNLLKDKQQTGLFLNIAGSYVHMSLNRLFPVQARLHEYILYEFLNRYYTSAIFVRKQQSSPQHPTYYQAPLNT